MVLSNEGVMKMPGVTLPYKLKTTLREKIEVKRAEKVIELNCKVNIGDIDDELSEFVGTGVQNIKKIKSGHIRPSILTALKMAEYFNCKVEDLFMIED